MGFDIHGVFQRHDEESNTWQDVESVYEQDRHYFLFGVLADVRGDGPAISEPRGVPEGFELDGDDHPISDLKYMDPKRRGWHEANEPLVVWMGEHSHSWLAGEEMMKWYESAKAEERESLAYFFNEVARLAAEYGRIRFVFGFDC
jgi:hypothetical protein